ncbi:uncharacterized protein GLRG_07685 [Colletotrichum graminicola M1.001]|uniref:Exonuclease domain-containing protein n=1 Tax=Colletotrichum graminicola (strain M1.001 / M2 / FGSC 10212) TaxID=645133 RepID=E3QNQ8_COLGM|nr:uncharacterized protein GLRG_07685 [Colletotrichum graminicola M1.001]EFQ32415.1 hypothetical protein GLRG_07685 [Colletotrichum graminicola M1.001]
MSSVTLSKEHERAHCQKGFLTDSAKNEHAQMKDASEATQKATIASEPPSSATCRGENELIQITMIDFLSGKVLQSCLVNPSRPIIDWREDITGISTVLHDWEAARAELWRFADKERILIGQSVYSDLKVLHVSHSRIIDSAIVTADAVLGKNLKIRKRWGLKTLCDELLGIRIRESSKKGWLWSSRCFGRCSCNERGGAAMCPRARQAKTLG